MHNTISTHHTNFESLFINQIKIKMLQCDHQKNEQ